MLNQRYPNPQQLLECLTKHNSQPQLTYSKHLRGRLWKANLTVHWPVRFRVCGQSGDQDRARHYAYLQACSMMGVSTIYIQASHPTWKTLKTWTFVICFSRPGKCLEFAQKVVKIWHFNLKPGKKTWILKIWCFQIKYSRCLYKKIIYICVIF